MSLSRHILRRIPPPIATVRFFSSDTDRHEYQPPNEHINSWKPFTNPREAQRHLASLRRDYARKVKVQRKKYIEEMELQRIEKAQRDEKKKEALMLANQERKAAKKARKKADAAEREASREEFRLVLMKERAEKLESWRIREQQLQEKKKEKQELLRRQSSLWVEESKLEERILSALTDVTPL